MQHRIFPDTDASAKLPKPRVANEPR